MDTAYVHGYTEPEARRLGDQADALADLLHAGTAYPAGSRVLEAGCGVGAQTVHLAARSPGAHLTAVDVEAASLAQARERVPGVDFRRADLFDLDGEYDHVFVCFVLEHLPEPEKALAHLKTLLRPGGTITVIEGDHGSAFFHPRSRPAQAAIDCLVRLQADAGGDALIGRRLHPLLTGAGFGDVAVEPRTVYADASRPDLVTGFTRDTFTAMVEGVGETAVARGLITRDRWEHGVADLHRTTRADGTFHYTFFKATGSRP
ncbi:Methyltransferase domain-containing protein [Amycolatopsis tolypomycina]|uniref:Methyltransferase domain-containing protein n=1 Tax=Amycolatopsis tolypomycina TaxID=208445 RepID=A0A1H4Q709_9PSEU|nr:methyltransferase [Amycolatopsis tolypomycina]SEC15416.1 Methyltransferase domain-containing protein [Amycolatopsis tolypomycina]